MIFDSDWPELAACKKETSFQFYPDLARPEGKEQQQNALNICKVCEVQALCREYALEYEFFGIWGGMTERQRARQRVLDGNKVVTEHYGMAINFLKRTRGKGQ